MGLATPGTLTRKATVPERPARFQDNGALSQSDCGTGAVAVGSRKTTPEETTWPA